VLDRLFVGEAIAPEAREHVKECERCVGRIGEREAAAAVFAKEAGFEVLVERSVRRTRMPVWRKVSIAGGAVAAAAALVLLLIPRERAAQNGDGVRTKGGRVSLGLVVKHLDGRIEAAVPPVRLSPGEAIEFEITARKPGFVAVYDVDHNGSSVYAQPRRIEAGPRQLLDGSIVLDESLGKERIFAVLCDGPIDLGAVKALDPEQMVELPLPAGCDQASVLIEKVPAADPR
jgi:hypothetical protein